jgi:choline dehydrogenase
MLSSYDYVVIGGGTAGSVVAARLSEGDGRVLLLEAGPIDPPQVVYDVESFPERLLGSAIDWTYTTVPQPGTENAVHFWSRGKVLGGSSTINAMGHIRGHRANYDGWAASGATGWSYEDLLPYFKRSETAPGRDPAFRGTHGPLRVAPMQCDGAGAEAFRQAVVEAGYPATDDISGREQVGAFRFDMNVVEGRRQSAADAYLRPVLHRANLHLAGSAMVHRLRVERGRCIGVEFVVDGVLQSVRAENEVVLCAGAIGSPQLLLLSGIGPADQLRALDIVVTTDLPGVGQNLQDHIASRLVYAVRKPMRTASNGFCPEAAMLRCDFAADAAPDVGLLLIDFPAAPAVVDDRFASMLPDTGYTIVFSHQGPSASRGSIRLASTNPEHAPIIDPRYYAEESDLSAMAEYLRVARLVGEAHGLSPWRDSEILPGPDVRDANDVRTYLRRSSGTSFHPVGTCRIGADPFGVVDTDLRVHGVQGLRVVDASVMPDIVSANPNATVVAIAERGAERIIAA